MCLNLREEDCVGAEGLGGLLLRGLWRVLVAGSREGEEGKVPVKCTSQDEVVVYRELVETFCEVALVY